MELHSEWKTIATKAWSFKLIALAGIFQTLEQVLPTLSSSIPPTLFAVLSGISITCALIARLIAQQEFKDVDIAKEFDKSSK